MKYIIILIFALFGVIMSAQEGSIKKPEYVIIANNQIITKTQLETYAKDGYIKGMNKGVSEESRIELIQEFGDKIGDREFIITLDLFTEDEKTENQNKTKASPKPAKENVAANHPIRVNTIAKDFTVHMITGEQLTLSDLKGKVVLLNFWATWCAPCLMEFYDIPDQILKPFNIEDFVFLPISIGENKDTVIKKMAQLKEKGIDFNSGYDIDKVIAKLYNTKSIPKNFIIDKNGIIRFISKGNSEGNVDTLAKEIQKLLKE